MAERGGSPELRDLSRIVDTVIRKLHAVPAELPEDSDSERCDSERCDSERCDPERCGPERCGLRAEWKRFRVEVERQLREHGSFADEELATVFLETPNGVPTPPDAAPAERAPRGPGQTQPLTVEGAASADENPSALAAGENEARLERENARLRQELEAARKRAKTSPRDRRRGLKGDVKLDSIAALEKAFRLRPEKLDKVSQRRLALALSQLARYFDKQRGNLAHAFDTLELSVVVPSLRRRLERAMTTPEDGVAELEIYLDELRVCWKLLVAGTWNHLQAGCSRVEETLDPEDIERESRTRGRTPWDVYQERLRNLKLYPLLFESIRTQLRESLREEARDSRGFLG